MPSNTNTRVNRYGALAAEIYDIDKPYFFLPDTRFHLEWLAAVDGPILEPACGTGRTLVPLLDAGHAMTGFDASPDMLERCRAKCAARGHNPPLSQQRFEDFRYAGIVDNFKFIGKGQPFAYQNGRPQMVDEDSYLLIPMKPEETKIREEVCYLGRKVEVA